MRLSIMVFLISFRCLSNDNSNKDIKVKISPDLDPPLTETQKIREEKYNELHLRASSGLPYRNMDDVIANKSFFTIGNGVKKCAYIAITKGQSGYSIIYGTNEVAPVNKP